jgi:hypothetical protein
MESIGFTCNFFLLQIFTLKDFLYLKNEFRAKNFFRLSRGVAGGFWTKFEAQLAQPCWVLESWNFDFKLHLSQLGVPHTQNFVILKFLEKLRRQKKIENSFETFQSMLDFSNFGKRCFLGISIQICFQIWKILNVL